MWHNKNQCCSSGSFSAPPLSIISAPAIYYHFKLYYNSSTIRNKFRLRFSLILASSKLTAVNNKYLLKRSFRLRLQVSNNFGFTGSGSATDKNRPLSSCLNIGLLPEKSLPKSVKYLLSRWVSGQLIQSYPEHWRRINTYEKTKVVAAVWGT